MKLVSREQTVRLQTHVRKMLSHSSSFRVILGLKPRVLEIKHRRKTIRQLIVQTHPCLPVNSPKLSVLKLSTWWTFAIGLGESVTSSAKQIRWLFDPDTIKLPVRSILKKSDRTDCCLSIPDFVPIAETSPDDSASVDVVLTVGDSCLAGGSVCESTSKVLVILVMTYTNNSTE